MAPLSKSDLPFAPTLQTSKLSSNMEVLVSVVLPKAGGYMYWIETPGVHEPHSFGVIDVVCVLAAPEGIEHLRTTGLNLRIFTAAMDERLNENAFIVPGLGDAGDRQFGAPH